MSDRQRVAIDIPTARAFVPLLNEDVRYLGAHGGRGSGKSHFFAESLIDRCLRVPRTRWACLRETQASLKQSVKLLVEDKIEALGVGRHFRVLETHIETPGDGILTFQGMQNHTAESIKSLEDYDGAWFEEAHKASQFSLGILRPTIRKPGSQIWFSWNPLSVKDPVDALLRGPDRVDDAVVVESNYEDNPFFPEVLRREMEYDRRRDPDRYAHVWLGKYQQQSEARVFKNWRVEEFKTPSDARFHLGADWGFSVDPSVLIRCFAVGRTLYIDYEAWEIGCDIDYTPFLFGGMRDQELIRLNSEAHRKIRSVKSWQGVPGARVWPLVADSANPQAISYMSRHGFANMRASVKGVGSVEEGVEFLKSYDIVVHPRCPHVIDELSTYSYEIDKRTEEILPKLADKKNHTIDSVRYAVEPLRRGSPEPQFGSY